MVLEEAVARVWLQVSVRMGDAVVVIAKTGGPGAFQLADRVGVVRPAHCTALGKVMLASLDDAQLRSYLDRADLEPWTAKNRPQHRA